MECARLLAHWSTGASLFALPSYTQLLETQEHASYSFVPALTQPRACTPQRLSTMAPKVADADEHQSQVAPVTDICVCFLSYFLFILVF